MMFLCFAATVDQSTPHPVYSFPDLNARERSRIKQTNSEISEVSRWLFGSAGSRGGLP